MEINLAQHSYCSGLNVLALRAAKDSQNENLSHVNTQQCR
jgi:hypothetical protein